MGMLESLGVADAPPPPVVAATYKEGETLVDEGSVAPLNAGKTVGDTKPNAVQPPAPIEFIHFGRVHRSRVNLFKHPLFPTREPPKPKPGKQKDDSKDDSSGSSGSSTSSGGSGGGSSGGGGGGGGSDSGGELYDNPLFRKKAKEHDADWLKGVDPTPGTPNDPVKPAPPPEEEAKKSSKKEDAGKQEEEETEEENADRDGPAGQAILMRDALLREALLLRGFIDSTVAVYKEWKEAQLLPTFKAPNATCLDHCKKDVGKAAAEINAEFAEYPKLHEAGLKLHRTRAQYDDYAVSTLDPYYGKPVEGLDALMPQTPGFGALLKPLFFLTFNAHGVYYKIHLVLRRVYEPLIEEACRERSMAVLKEPGAESYSIWGSPDGKAPPAGKPQVDRIFVKLIGEGEPEPADEGKGDAAKKTDDDKSKSQPAQKQESEKKEDQNKKEEQNKPEEPVVPTAHELVHAAMAVACRDKKLAVPIRTWVERWVKWDVEALKKVYDKLFDTLADPDTAIDEEFVQTAMGVDGKAKALKVLNCTLDLMIASLRAASGFRDVAVGQKAAEKVEQAGPFSKSDAEKASAEYHEQKKALEKEKFDAGGALQKKLHGDSKYQEADRKLKELNEAEQAKVEEEKARMQAAVADGTIKHNEYESWLKARTEEPPPDPWDEMEKNLKKIEKYRDDVKGAIEKLNEVTIKAIATDLDGARSEAAGAGALTMEVYLARLPRLISLLTLNTTVIAWKLALGALFDVIIRDVDSEITREIRDFKSGPDMKEKAGGAADAAKALYAAAKPPAQDEGGEMFPPSKRIIVCTGIDIGKGDREEAAAQIVTAETPTSKVDKPASLFIEET